MLQIWEIVEVFYTEKWIKINLVLNYPMIMFLVLKTNDLEYIEMEDKQIGKQLRVKKQDL